MGFDFGNFMFGPDARQVDPLSAADLNKPYEGIGAPDLMSSLGDMRGLSQMLNSLFGDRRAAMKREAIAAGANRGRQAGNMQAMTGLGGPRGAMADSTFSDMFQVEGAMNDLIGSSLPSFMGQMNQARMDEFGGLMSLAGAESDSMMNAFQTAIASAQNFNQNKGGGLWGGLMDASQMYANLKGGGGGGGTPA